MKRSDALKGCLKLYGRSSGRGKLIAVFIALALLAPVAYTLWEQRHVESARKAIEAKEVQ